MLAGADFETYGYADVIPIYFYGALGNIASEENSDGEAQYKHTIKLGDLLPYLTLWGRVGQEYSEVDGCKIDQLELSFEGNQPLAFGVTAMGISGKRLLEKFPGNTDPSCFDGYFTTAGGVFKLDTSSETPQEAPVVSGSLTLANSCAAEPLAGKVSAGDVEEGKLTTSGTITVKPENLDLYWAMVTGEAKGTTPTSKIVYGSFEWVFEHSQNPNYKLTITSGRVPFNAEYPSVDPAGGAAQMDFTFDDIGITEASGSPITVVVLNDVEKYVDPAAAAMLRSKNPKIAKPAAVAEAKTAKE